MDRPIAPAVRFFYRHLYNRLAFSYDAVSVMVSRGEWRAWARSAIPFLQGPRVLEVACGTGSLEVDLYSRGFEPIGLDLSPFMLEQTRSKLRRSGHPAVLVRARVQMLPFRAASFDSLVMTFPPGFVTDEEAMQEMHRVLAPGGRLVWVDAPYLSPRDPWSRFLNWAYRLANGGPLEEQSDEEPRREDRSSIQNWLPRNGWDWRVERIKMPASEIHVLIANKEAV
ncbi:MAG: class I SAM-dependent methyltransferase [Rudaea sp.]